MVTDDEAEQQADRIERIIADGTEETTTSDGKQVKRRSLDELLRIQNMLANRNATNRAARPSFVCGFKRDL